MLGIGLTDDRNEEFHVDDYKKERVKSYDSRDMNDIRCLTNIDEQLQ